MTYLRDPDCWIVWDRAQATQSVTLEQHWQTDVGLKARHRDNGFRLYDSSRHMTMTWLGSGARLRRHDAAEGDLTGWVGTRWKTLNEGSRLTASSTGDAPQLVTLIGAHSPTPLGLLDSYVMKRGHLTASLVRGGSWWVATIDGDSIRVERR